MKNLLIAILAMSCTFIYSQNIVEWKGGTPGNNSAWTESRNWVPNRVPNEFSHVIIKTKNNGHFSNPVIETEVELASLTVKSGAILTIEKEGLLKIDGRQVFTYGLINNGGKIYNKGIINMYDLENSRSSFKPFDIGGQGLIYIDGELKNASFATNEW